MSGLGWGCHSRCGSRRTSTNCLKVLNRHFLECESALSWQSAKTPGGGSFGHPRQEECLCLTIHIATALHLLFSACALDVTSTVMTRMHVRSSMRAHSPLSGSSVNESCAQDTEQIHGKHGSGALLSSFPLLLVAVLAEHGGCLSSVDRDRGLRGSAKLANLERARSSSERV